MYLVPIFSSHTGWPLSKFPQKHCNHLIAVGLLTKKNPTLWKLSHSGGAELHRLIMGLTLNYMTLTKWSDSWDSTLQTPPSSQKKGKKALYDRNGQQKMRGTTQSWWWKLASGCAVGVNSRGCIHFLCKWVAGTHTDTHRSTTHRVPTLSCEHAQTLRTQ